MKKPNLLTIYELTRPINLAKDKLQEIVNILHEDELKDVALQGLFVLGLSNFEIMLTDILRVYLKYFPQKMDFKEVKISKENILNDNVIILQINKTLAFQTYKRFDDYLKYFCKTLSIAIDSDDQYIDKLVEMKETRNLLLHNDLIVNENYLYKTSKYKRCKNMGGELTINKDYSLTSFSLLNKYICQIETKIKEKYSKYKKIAALKNLWEYLFDSPLLKFEDYWGIDEEKDRISALKKMSYEEQLATSEKMFLGMWRSHFNTKKEHIKYFNMINLDSINRAKMVYFLSVADKITMYSQ